MGNLDSFFPIPFVEPDQEKTKLVEALLYED